MRDVRILKRAEYERRLREDPRARRVWTLLERRGASPTYTRGFADEAAGYPERWLALTLETASERCVRHQKLTSLLRKVAAAIDADPDFAHVRLLEIRDGAQPGDSEVHIAQHTPFANRPTLAAVLRMVADEEWSEPFAGSVVRRMKLHVFAVRAAFFRLSRIPFMSTRPLKPATEIASALLDQNISPNSFARDPVIARMRAAKPYHRERTMKNPPRVSRKTSLFAASTRRA